MYTYMCVAFSGAMFINLGMCISIYVFVFVSACFMCVYMCTYILCRDREKATSDACIGTGPVDLMFQVHYTYIYKYVVIYIYIFTYS